MSRTPILAFALLLGSAVFVSPCARAQTEMAHEHAPGPLVTALAIHTPAGSATLSLEDLKAKPHITVTVHNPHTNADETYSGVPLIELLAPLGTPHGKDLHGKGLSDYIIATGSDGYKAVIALAEIDPEFHPGQVLVADTMDGKPIDAKTGPFRLVVSEDKRPARSVHNLASIELKAAE
ncbi:molybdopterin-dependent oxidoreductase [Silvibacterium dinghuense]|nr:molybdopterin-dependent oxidoreductase [Silvibacterium dinghuense]GGG94638.1 hypothetical protein GCM10011586_06950 [Silvibacterium dinghuense]